jgi:predicted transcriptional regulator
VELTKCEAEVMAVVWEQGTVTVSDVVNTLERDLAYTTVLTTLKILEEKNIVRRGDKIGRAYTYLPNVTQDEVQQSMLRRLTEQLFGGSARSLVLSMIQSNAVSEADLKAIRKAADDLEQRK